MIFYCDLREAGDCETGINMILEELAGKQFLAKGGERGEWLRCE